MASFCSIHEHIVNSGTSKGSVLKYSWAIFSNNMRKIAESPRLYNRPHHAKDAAKRFVRSLSNVHFRDGVVRK